MLKRIVRMEFDPEKVENFLALFDDVKDRIAAQEGCSHVALCKDAKLNHVYFTFSIWDREEDLENYRKSDLFETTWARTKVLFSEKPQAFSLLEKSA